MRHVILLWIAFWSGLSLAIAPNSTAQTAQPVPVTGRYASIIVDVDNQEIIHARQIDEARFPASLTKVMTLYLTFDALDQGRLKIDQPLPVSAYAASQPPTKLGLKAGQKLLVRDAINALIIRSSNDAAMVLAEAIGGSEQNFAALMTQRAHQLGMQRTVFRNPHGLPNTEHRSTARDMAKLTHAMIRDHRSYYPLFAQTSMRYKGRTLKTTNALLGQTLGVDGLKTGYTNASGYNLTISAQREGRRLVAVVMGGASGKSRDQHMRDLIERGFEVILKKPQTTAPRVTVRRDPLPHRSQVQNASTAILNLRGSNGQIQPVIQGPKPRLARPKTREWNVFLGDFPSSTAAKDHISRVMRGAVAPDAKPHVTRQNAQFQARLGGLSHAGANRLCEHLIQHQQTCLMVQVTAP